MVRVSLILLLLFVSILHGRVITVYVNAHLDVEKTAGRWDATIDMLNQKIPEHHFKLLALKPTEIDTIKQLLSRKKIDFLITQPAIYVTLQHSNNIIKLLTMSNRFDMSTFGSVFITRSGSGIQSLADIKGKEIAAVAPLGFGGWLIGYNELYEAGIDPVADKKVTFLGSQKRVVDAVLDRGYDVGIIRTGMLEKLSEKGWVDMKSIRVINEKEGYPVKLSTRLFPEWAFAAASHVEPALVNRVFKVMNAIRPDDRAARDGEYSDWHIPGNYNEVDELFKRFRIGHYADMPEYDREHLIRITVVMTLFLILVAALIILRTRYQMQKNLKKELQAEVREKTRELHELNRTLESRVKAQLKELRMKDKMLVQNAKMAEMGEMIAAISHQLKQPLNAIGLVSQIVKTDIMENEMDGAIERLDKVNGYVTFMSATIDEFRSFFRQDKKREAFYLNETIRSIEKIFEYHLKLASIVLHIDVDPSLQSYGYPTEFKQVLLNLINNAKDALKIRDAKDGWIRITASTEGDDLAVTVSDNGGGIPEVLLEKIFDPYFTTKKKTGGTGIGLHIIRAIIEEHMNGTISVHNDKDGAVFVIRIPRYQKEEKEKSTGRQ